MTARIDEEDGGLRNVGPHKCTTLSYPQVQQEAVIMANENPATVREPISKNDLAKALTQTPLGVAIITAVVGGVLSLALAAFNSAEQRKLEERKFEEGRIIELLRTGSVERAAENLEFLVKSGLVRDAQLAAGIDSYRKSKSKGQGPVLPVYDTVTTYPTYGGGTTHITKFEGKPVVIVCDDVAHSCVVEPLNASPDRKP